MARAEVEPNTSGQDTNDMSARLVRLAEKLRVEYDIQPVMKAEWDAACNDES
jgi:hypothetical protein